MRYLKKKKSSLSLSLCPVPWFRRFQTSHRWASLVGHSWETREQDKQPRSNKTNYGGIPDIKWGVKWCPVDDVEGNALRQVCLFKNCSSLSSPLENREVERHREGFPIVLELPIILKSSFQNIFFPEINPQKFSGYLVIPQSFHK